MWLDNMEINTQHPEWLAFWNSKTEFSRPTKKTKKPWGKTKPHVVRWIENFLQKYWPRYDRVYLFEDLNGENYIVVRHIRPAGAISYGTTQKTFGDQERNHFSLESAAQETLLNWLTIGGRGQWQVKGNFAQCFVDNEWLVRGNFDLIE